MVNLNLTMRKNKIGISGIGPIYIRMSKNRKNHYNSTGIKVHKNDWDERSQIWDKVKEEWNIDDVIAAHNYTVNKIALQPGGQLFATASRDKTIKLWRSDPVELLKVINKEKFEIFKIKKTKNILKIYKKTYSKIITTYQIIKYLTYPQQEGHCSSACCRF